VGEAVVVNVVGSHDELESMPGARLTLEEIER
jgi:hypothetical protein